MNQILDSSKLTNIKKITMNKNRITSEERERINDVKTRLNKILSELCQYYDFQQKQKYQVGVGEKEIVNVIDQSLSQIDKYLDVIERLGQNKKEFIFKVKDSQIISEDDKPQNYFKDFIDNSEKPFVPKLTVKQCSSTDLPRLIIEAQNDKNFFNLQDDPKNFEFENPYKDEITQLQPINFTYMENYLENYEPQKIMGKNFSYIDNEDRFQDMIIELQSELIIAIDLENHSQRSYQGFLCLMQISSLKKDYIIDTITLRSEISKLLTIFANSNILKVFHGGQQDIIWLQRDFGIYVVNMIDTYQIAKTFRQKNGYASLLSHYYNINTDKTFQKADWRIRPLSSEMIRYARMDTHYLLGVLKKLIRDMVSHCYKLQIDPAEQYYQIIENCKSICMRMYKKHQTMGENYQKIIFKLELTNSQKNEFDKIWIWRNTLARDLDESEDYIIKNSSIIQIVKKIENFQTILNKEYNYGKSKQNIYFKAKEFFQNLYSIQNNEKKVETKGLQLKRFQQSNLFEQLKPFQIWDLNWIYNYDFQFQVKSSLHNIYEFENQNQSKNFDLQNFIDFSQFQQNVSNQEDEKKTIQNLEQNYTETPNEILIDNLNDYNQEKLTGIDLMNNLKSLSIPQSLKNRLMSDLNPKQMTREKPIVYQDQTQQDIFESSIKNTQDKIKNERMKKKNYFQEAKPKSKKKLPKSKGKKNYF